MPQPARERGFSLTHCLVVTSLAIATTSLVAYGAIQDTASPIALSAQNCRELVLSGIMYGGDYDDTLPVLVNGPYRSMTDTLDGVLTPYNEQRTDGWPLLELPYIRSRGIYVDPQRGDAKKYWSGPAKAKREPGYDLHGATFRNQNRFPMYGVNYQFLSPGLIPEKRMGARNAMDYMVGEAHTFTEADDPANTIYKLASCRTSDASEGYFVVNAPGLAQVMSNDIPYVMFFERTRCGADWCNDADPSKDGAQSVTSTAYFNAGRKCPITFMDGHAKIMTDVEAAAGTNYLSATPNDGGRPNTNCAGALITDKRSYLWNLTDNYYGA